MVIPQIGFVLIFMVYKCYTFFYYMKPAIKESERLAQSTGAPIFALAKSSFNGISVIRAFGKQNECTETFLQAVHKDILFFDLNLAIQAFNMQQTQFVKLLVISCSFCACIYLRGSVETVTLSMLMLRMCSLDEKTTRSLRYTNQIKNRMYSI